MRALGAAMLRRETDRPIFVLCTDETNAGTLAADLEALLGESVVQLTDGISRCAISRSYPGRRSSGGCVRSMRSMPARSSRYAPFPAFCSARCRRIF